MNETNDEVLLSVVWRVSMSELERVVMLLVSSKHDLKLVMVYPAIPEDGNSIKLTSSD
jgi:hypothetical protein